MSGVEIQDFQPLTNLLDHELMLRYQNGDLEADDVLFTRVRKSLVIHIAQYAPTLTLDEREDAVADVMSKALSLISKYDGRNGASLTTFFKKVAVFHLIDRLRKEKSCKKKYAFVSITNKVEDSDCGQNSDVSEETLVCHEPGPEAIFFAKQQAKHDPAVIRKCWGMLTPYEQRVLQMHAAKVTLSVMADSLWNEGFTGRLLTPPGVRHVREEARKKFAGLLESHDIKVKL